MGDRSNPPLGSAKKRSIKANENDRERKLAEKLQGQRQPASGALPSHRGDIKLDNFLLDSKAALTATSITVTGKDLVKITSEADGEMRYPGLILSLDKIKACESTWVVIPLSAFYKMVVENKQDSKLKE